MGAKSPGDRGCLAAPRTHRYPKGLSMPAVHPSPEFDTDRLRLVPVDDCHAAAIHAEFTAEITRFMHPRPAASLDETLSFIALSRGEMRLGRAIQWVMVDRHQVMNFVGCIGLHGIDERVPELGLWVAESRQGAGVGSEAATAALRWAQSHLPHVAAVRYPVDRRNRASRRIPERLGGTIQREFVSVSLGGQTLDQLEYLIPLTSRDFHPGDPT
jgi:ribosomal-protein-alanine N-acetyltransferase